MRSEFIIIGGGIAGLTAAIALKRIGIDATVMEATPAFSPVGAGIVLAANAMKAYLYLSLYDQLSAAGSAVDQFTIYDDKGKVISRVSTNEPRNSLADIAIHRASLHEVLLSQLDKDRIVTGKRATGFTKTGETFSIRFQDGTEEEARYLIVADGIHSPIRKQLIPKSRIRYAGCTCWRGITDNTSINMKETSETWGREGRFGSVQLPDHKIYWFACKNARENDSQMKEYGIRELTENFSHYHAPISTIIESTHPAQMIWNDIYDLEPISRFAFGNLVLMGDAAHATTPNMGQGACQAIEDAVILANCIKRSSEVREAFTSFEKQRLDRTHAIVKQSWRLGKLAQVENKLLIDARNFICRRLPQQFYEKQLAMVYDVDFGER